MSEMIGAWQTLINNMKNFEQTLKTESKLALQQSGLLLERYLVLHIQNQDLGWKGLSPLYLKWKRKKKKSEHILILTSGLLTSITSQVRQSGDVVFVGSNRRVGKYSLAAIHEYGSPKRKISKRPLFEPTLKEKQPEIIEHIKKGIEKAIRSVSG